MIRNEDPYQPGDYFGGVQFSAGRIFLNDKPGIGAAPIPDFFK